MAGLALKRAGRSVISRAAASRKGATAIEEIGTKEGFRAFRGVIRSLMRDASRHLEETSDGASREELRERMGIVGHYLDYALRYCDECPLIGEAPEESGRLGAIELPGTG